MKKVKKFLCLVLAVVMLVSIVPICRMQIIADAAAISLNRPLDKEYTITAREYYSGGSYHGALDYGVPKLTPVYAAENGVISIHDGGYGDGYYGCQDGYTYGNHAIISHYDGWVTYYAHMTTGKFVVKSGDSVKRGQLIGYSGNSGSSTGPHLHFELRQNGTKIYVEPYIKTASGYFSSTSPIQEPTKIVYPTNGGIFKLASGVGNNMYLDFACASDNVQIYENCDGHSNPDYVKSQYFKLTHVGDGWYSVINTGNGLAMDIKSANSAPETNIHQYESNGTDAQLFRFYDAGDGYYYIKSKLGCYVDVKWGDSANNTNVWTYTFNGENSQKWKLQSHSHSYTSKVTTAASCTKTGVKTFTCYCGVSYTETIAKNAHSYTSSITTQPTCAKEGVRTYKCSNCSASYTEKIAMTSHTNKNGDNKCDVCGYIYKAEPTTIIYPTNGGIYKIATGVGDNMYLDFSLSRDKIQIYENCDNHSELDYVKSQYFKLTHVGDGWYTITNIGNNLLVDVSEESFSPGTIVLQREYHGKDDQLFRFYDAGDGYVCIKSKYDLYLDVIDGVNANHTSVGVFLFNGSSTQKWKLENHAHTYSSSITTQPTCSKEGVETFTCFCGDSYTKTIAKTAHNSNTIIPAVAPTCTKTGLTEGKKCSACGTVTVAPKTVAALGHNDANGDYKCDNGCGYEYEKPAPDTPSDPSKNCSCNCHKGGIAGFFFRIILFFQKLFRTNKTCGCGIAHY